MNSKKHLSIVAFCEKCLDTYGDNYLGVGWTKRQEDADTRYRTMLDVIKPRPDGTEGKVSVLDFGCGASHLYEYILRHGIRDVEYSGLDVSDRFIQLSKRKFPFIRYYYGDILADDMELPVFDYVILNGMFNAKFDLSFDEMLAYFQNVLVRVFQNVRVGMAFNVTSKQVDWERADLFHLPFDTLASFLTRQISRNFVIRHDYRLYEYTTYVYR